MKKNQTKMHKETLLTLVILAVLTACRNATDTASFQNTISAEKIEIADEAYTQNIMESVSFIPLEETPECLLGDVRKLQKTGQEFFVMAEGSDRMPGIFRFTLEGKLKNKIGRAGNARDEYLRIGSFFVWEEKVFIADVYKKKILVYSTDGVFIESFDCEKDITFIHDMMVIGNDKALFSYNINFSESNALYKMVDLNSFKTLHTLTTRFKATGSSPYSLKEMGCMEKDVLLTSPFENMVYKLDSVNFTLEKYLAIEIWGDIPTGKSDDFDEANAIVEEAGVQQLYGFFVSENKILINSLQGSILWHTDSGKGMLLEDGVDLDDIKVFPFFPLSVAYSDKDGFYSIFTAEGFISIIKDIGDSGEGTAPSEEFVNTIQGQNNPVIVWYKMK